MQRREFLKAVGTAGLATTPLASGIFDTQPRTAASEAGAPKDLAVRQLETDHFVLEFSPAQPRPFRILQLTDTHFGSSEPAAKERDRRSFAEIRQMVARHRIDFVVHTGDFINNDGGPKVSFEAVEFFDDLGLPWTHALGNHDIGAVPIEDYRKMMKHAAFGHFDTPDGPEYAFRFDLVSAAQREPAYTLFCLDSGFRMPQKHVSARKLEWFDRQLQKDAERGVGVPALAMIHIPMVEFEKLRAAERFAGIYGERVCFESDTGNTFNAFRKSGRVKAVFSGHDHQNDYCGGWEGVELVYGRVSGWNGYGDLQRGGRLIEIDLAAQRYSHRLAFPEG